jgi:molybdopterin synthase sulfur carrier subunit
MRIKAKFFAHFRDLFGGRETDVDLGAGRAVRDALSLLCDTPVRRTEIFHADGLRPHVVVMVNGVHIRTLQGLETELAEGDTLAVFPFLVGG